MKRRASRLALVAASAVAVLAGIIYWNRPTAVRAHPDPVAATYLRSSARHDAPAWSPLPPSQSLDTTLGQDEPVDPEQARCANDRRRQLQARRDQLQALDTPDEAIEHALLTTMLSMQSHDHGVASREFQAARRRWPDNLDLAWFSQQHCLEQSACDPDAEWLHLVSLDPDNAAVWLVAMAQARNEHDDARYEQALERAANAGIYDPRTGTTFLRARSMLRALSPPQSCQSPARVAAFSAQLGRPPVSSDWARVEAMAFELASLPPYAALTSCKETAPPLSITRRQDCMALLSQLANGDSLLEQSLALALMIPLAGDGPNGKQLRERYRRLSWLKTHHVQPVIPEDYVVNIWTKGEVATLQALAVERGQWPPPPGWLPSDSRSRTLIRTGRAPPQGH